VTGATAAEAGRKLREVTKLKHRDEITTGSRQSLEWLMAQWLATKAHREANTRGTYERYTRLWVSPHLGRMTLKQLDTREAKTAIQSWVNGMGKSLGPKSIRHAHATLSGALNWGIAEGYLTRNASKGVELPTLTPYRFKLIEPEDFAAFQRTAQGHKLLAAYVLTFSRSLRPEEVQGLCRDDIDLNRGTVTLRHALVWVRRERDAQGQPVPGHFELKDTLKTPDSAQVLTLTKPELDLLRERLHAQKEERIKAGPAWEGNPWRLVFTTDTGRPLHHRDLYRPFQRLLKASGFNGKARLYDMRHGGISKVAVDFDLKTAQVFARHKQFSTTADIYAHVSDRRKLEVGLAMGGLVLCPSAN
jgi:integrase